MAVIDLSKLNFGQFNPNLVKQTAAAQAAVGNPSPVQSSPSPLPAAPIDMSKVDFSPWRNAPAPIGAGQQTTTQQQTNPINPVQVTPQARPQVPQITPQIQQTNPAAGMGNAQNYIDQLIAAQKSAQLAALGKSRDNALSNLGAEKAGIQPKYQDARNQAAGGAQQQARNFAEYMANRGGSSSGANAQAQISNNMALQSSLGSLGRQETAAFTDIGRRETDVGNAFESDVVSAQAGLEADRMKALLSDYYIAQQRGDALAQRNIENQLAQAQLQMQQAGLTGQFNGQTTVQQQQNQFNNGLNLAGLTGNYLGQDTLAKTQADRGYGLDVAGLTGQLPGGGQTLQAQQISADNQFRQQTFERGNFESDRSFELAKTGQEWSQLLQKETFDFNKAQSLYENSFKERSFQKDVEEAAASRGLQWATLNQRDKEFVADQAFREKSFAAEQEDRTSKNISAELEGLFDGITSGQITPSAAIAEINGKVAAGFMSKADGAQLLEIARTTNPPTQGMTEATPDQVTAFGGGENPQSLNREQLDQLWRTDPSGKAANRPSIDWGQWYKDPKGRLGGVSYDSWKLDHGPQLKAGS